MPTNLKHSLFISDLHLSPKYPQITALFLDFIRNIAPQAEALYILGDLFRLWLGDDDHTPFNLKIITALNTLSQHTKIYLLPGNRDFMLGPTFAAASGCALLPDPYKINLYGTPTLLSHGDMFCTKDIKHLIFRKLIYTNKLGQKLFALFPLSTRQNIAEIVHNYSYRNNQKKQHSAPYISAQKIAKFMRENQTQLLIYGHLHKAMQGKLSITDNHNNAAQYFVLDAWNTTGNCLAYYADGTYKVQVFSATTIAPTEDD